MNFLKRFILSLFHNSPIGGRGAKRLILSFVLSSPFWGLEGFAQNYPVVVTPFVKTAYSLRWQDYANNDQMLRINLILRDQAKDDIEVYIYFTIKGLGWSISTNPNFVPSQKIKLQRGVPTILRGPDIAEYLAPANVVVEGLPPELVRQGGKLPEGFCSIEVYAHEGFRDRQVSNLGRFDFSIFDLKPPLLFSPAEAQTLRAISPPRVLFNWVPQSPILAITGQMPLYRLQVWDASDQAPNATALTNSDKVWTKDVATTSTLMGPDANLTLQEGKRYAWRVTLLQDSQDNSIENQGQSEVWSFLWGGACLPPDPIVLQDWGGGVYRAAWEAISGVDGYLVRFREAGSNAPWQERITQSQSWSLSGPRPFEVQVATVCGTITGQPSPTVRVGKPNAPANARTAAGSAEPNPTTTNAIKPSTIVRIDQNGNPVTTPTPAMEEMVTELQKIPPPKCAQLISTQADCKDQTTPITYAGQPQTALEVGHVVAMHNYKIIVTAISSASGNTYSGEGLAAWPFLGESALVAVKLNNITVVKDKEDTRGGCITKGEAVAGIKGLLDADVRARTQTLYDFLQNPTYFTADLERAAEALANKAKELKGKTTPPTADDLKYYKQYAAATKAGLEAWKREIEANIPTPRPEVVTQILAQIQTQITQLATAINSPPSGEWEALPAQIAAWKTQMAQFLSPNRSQLSQMDFSKGRVTFAKSSDSYPYGFDSFDPSRGSIEADYPNLGEGYKVSYLSLKANEAGTVTANFEPKTPTDPDFTPERIRFVDSQGKTLTSTYNAATKKWSITLPADNEGQSEVFAYFQAPGKEAKSIGKMLVKRWKVKEKKLQIVRLGNVASVDGSALSTALSNIYKPALTQWQVTVGGKNVYFDYKDGLMDADGLASFSNYSPEMKALMSAYFGANKVDNPDTYYLFVVPGFKPADVKGYMPRGRNVGFVSDVSARTIAHELGHGAFGLHHSFDEQPASQSNLLDYGTGTYLTAAQWDKIQNPGIILNWFDEMEDAMSQSEVEQYALCIADATAFKGGTFKIFREGYKKLKANDVPYAFLPNTGELYSFKVNGVEYVPYKKGSEHVGYAPRKTIPTTFYAFEAANGTPAVNVEIATASATTTVRLNSTEFVAEKCFEAGTDRLPKHELALNSGSYVKWLQAQTGMRGKLHETTANSYDLKVFVTDASTPNRKELIAQVTKPAPKAIHLWIDYTADGKAKYEFFYGSDAQILRSQESDSFFADWLRALKPVPSMAINPLALLMNGIADLVGQFKIPPKYWDCARADYVSLPFVTQGDCPDECITPEGWAFVVGLWDGLVGEVKGVPEGIGAIAKDPVAVAQAIGKLVTLDGPTWAAIKDKVVKEYTEAAGKPCQISHLVATDLVAVATIVLPLTKLSKANIATTLTNLADNTLLTLTKFKVAGQMTYRVSTGTITIAKEGVGVLINRIGATAMWGIGEGIDLFGNGTSYALAMTTNGYEAIGPNGFKILGELLMEDANQAIVKMKQAGNEVLAVISTDIKPILLNTGDDFTILTNARKLSGTVTGNGNNITGRWLRGTEGNAGLFPKSVADKLRGRTFNNFDEFREAFWKEVANEPNLANQFDANSIQRMQGGLAPFTSVSQQIGGMKNYVLHHKTPINQGGSVYDMDNLYIVTPKYHKEILNPAYHYGYGY